MLLQPAEVEVALNLSQKETLGLSADLDLDLGYRVAVEKALKSDWEADQLFLTHMHKHTCLLHLPLSDQVK